MKAPLRCTTLLLVICICFVACALTQDSPSAEPGQHSSAAPASEAASSMITIPGPLRSFLRMAGISQKVSPDEVVPLLARNVFSQGYEGSPTKGHPTEFLILLSRYVQQARELANLAGSDHVI